MSFSDDKLNFGGVAIAASVCRTDSTKSSGKLGPFIHILLFLKN